MYANVRETLTCYEATTIHSQISQMIEEQRSRKSVLATKVVEVTGSLRQASKSYDVKYHKL